MMPIKIKLLGSIFDYPKGTICEIINISDGYKGKIAEIKFPDRYDTVLLCYPSDFYKEI